MNCTFVENIENSVLDIFIPIMPCGYLEYGKSKILQYSYVICGAKVSVFCSSDNADIFFREPLEFVERVYFEQLQSLSDIAWPIGERHEFFFGYTFKEKEFYPTNEEREKRALLYKRIDADERASGIDFLAQEEIYSQAVSNKAMRIVYWNGFLSKPNVSAIADLVILYVLTGSGR